MKRPIALAGRLGAVGAGLAAASYAAYVATTSWRYGRVNTRVADDERDELLDRFMPTYDVVERHHVRVDAPAAITFEVGTEMYLEQSSLVRWIFKAREWIMNSHPRPEIQVRPFLDKMRGIGWGVLTEIPGREIVMGAITRPWMADVVFRPLSPEAFASFHEPDYVKIVWTLRADPLGAASSIFRTETRVATTDATARAKFSTILGVRLSRHHPDSVASLRPLKVEAERRTQVAGGPKPAEVTS